MDPLNIKYMRLLFLHFRLYFFKKDQQRKRIQRIQQSKIKTDKRRSQYRAPHSS